MSHREAFERFFEKGDLCKKPVLRTRETGLCTWLVVDDDGEIPGALDQCVVEWSTGHFLLGCIYIYTYEYIYIYKHI